MLYLVVEGALYSVRRLIYYFRSIITIMVGIRNLSAVLAIAARRGPVLLEMADGSRYWVKTFMDVWIIKETVLDRDYERYGTALQDDWVIVDIGAAAGDFTVFAARRVPRGRVIAYEPAPDSAAMLRQNVAVNGLSNVEIHQVAVGAQEGDVILDTSGGVAVKYRTAGAPASGERLTVHSVPLARVLEELPDGRCEFLKIDAEGAEYDILLNLDDDALGHIRRVCLEYHEGVTPYSHADLERFFRTKGWSVRVSPSLVREELGFLFAHAPVL